MLRGLGRRFGHAPGATQPTADSLDLEVALYSDDCLVRGHLRLDGGRLTEMLSSHESLTLQDVHLTALDDGRQLDFSELAVARDELVAIGVTGPRGDPMRQYRTVPQQLALRGGPYQIWGSAHTLPGAEPAAYIRRRGPVVPLTEVLLAYELAGQAVAEELPGLIVNLDLIEQIVDPQAARQHAVDAFSLRSGSSSPGLSEQHP